MKTVKILILLILLIGFSCKNKAKEPVENISKTENETIVKYAKGFEIVEKDGIKKMLIKNAYQNSKNVFEYQIINFNKDSIIHYETNVNQIEVPVDEIVVTSTTHIPMLELLNEETSIVGFPFAQYVSSEKTRVLIDNGNITEIGKESSLNTEILLELQLNRMVFIKLVKLDHWLHSQISDWQCTQKHLLSKSWERTFLTLCKEVLLVPQA